LLLVCLGTRGKRGLRVDWLHCKGPPQAPSLDDTEVDRPELERVERGREQALGEGVGAIGHGGRLHAGTVAQAHRRRYGKSLLPDPCSRAAGLSTIAGESCRDAGT
jgi:hypothetical protein